MRFTPSAWVSRVDSLFALDAAESALRHVLHSAVALGLCVLLAGCGQRAETPAAPATAPTSQVPQTLLDKLSAAHEQYCSASGQHRTASGFDFPWTDLEEHIRQQPNQRVLIVGIGSLLNLESAAEDIQGVNEEEFFPVVAVGAKRLFNYLIPDNVLEELGGAPQPEQRAALNMLATGRSNDWFNGRILSVAAQDLDGLRKREHGYHLRPVTSIRWDSPDAEPFLAYVLCAEEEVVEGRQVIDNTIEPNPAYVEICLTGANSVSQEFAAIFLDTSYLADGKTSLRVWLATHPLPIAAESPSSP